jgi:hypothetical protein
MLLQVHIVFVLIEDPASSLLSPDSILSLWSALSNHIATTGIVDIKWRGIGSVHRHLKAGCGCLAHRSCLEPRRDDKVGLLIHEVERELETLGSDLFGKLYDRMILLVYILDHLKLVRPHTIVIHALLLQIRSIRLA